jgi:hypothetical protein|nr:MAG TPA: TrMBF1, Coactivator, Trichoderma reesei, helix-turn-helix [Caudoviricetes sp.]
MNKVHIQKFISYLKSIGAVKTQKEFALIIGYQSESAFSQAIAKVPIPVDTFDKIKNVYPEFEEFLKGSSHLEPQNWIEDDLSRYNSPNHDKTSLERLGLRLDEICRIKNISHQDLAKLLKIGYSDLLVLIAGNKPVPASLLEKIMKIMPEIKPLWLILGYGAMVDNKDEEIKRLKQELEELKKPTHPTENVDRRTA